MKLDFINGLKEGKKLSPRDVQMVLVIVGLILLVAVYFLVFQKYNEKNVEITTTLDERNAYLNELKGYRDNIEVYRAGVENSKKSIVANLKRLPVGYRAEDFLAWYVRTDEKLGTKTSSVSFSQVEPISEFSTYINDVLTPVVGYRFPTSASITMSYDQFKEYLAYVYDPGENFAYVDSVSVSFNSENALLSTVFNLSKFYIGYEGGAYEGEPEFDVNYGNDNPFRSK